MVRLQTRAKLFHSLEDEWREIGIGPLRILQNNESCAYRLVQRRENTPGGVGTKLILNLSLKAECCKAHRHADKYVRLVAIVPGDEEKDVKMYLFKVKTVPDADLLMRELDDVLTLC